MQNPEDNFDGLQRALKLKRHELPPPGYFNNFSAQVISRIRENDVHDQAKRFDAASWEAPWVTRLLGIFEARPIYAGVLGAAACALMIGGIIYSERPIAPALGGQATSLSSSPNFPGVGLLNTPTESSTLQSSASPIGALTPGTTLFDKIRPLESGTMPVFGRTNLLK